MISALQDKTQATSFGCQLAIYIVVTTSLRMTVRLLSKLKSEVSHRNYKKTQQGVSNAFLHYLYKYI